MVLAPILFFLIFGLPVLLRISPDSRLRTWAMYLSIGYLMVSWWPHLNMHAHNGMDLQGLLFIDHPIHLPLEIAGMVLAVCFFSLLRSWSSKRGWRRPRDRNRRARTV